jgi:N-acetylglutamate synthase-like GNAT family acetyltransferase
MMMNLTLVAVAGSDPALRDALLCESLPTDDLTEDGRLFFVGRSGVGEVVGFCGLEACGGDVLLRSLVVVPAFRGQGHGHVLAAMTISRAPAHGDVYLATTSATPLFTTLGFEPINRNDLPPAVLATRQLSGLCPASATVMKLARFRSEQQKSHDPIT